jgi:hypothetical protein
VKLGSRRDWFWRGVLLVAVSASVYAFVLAQRGGAKSSTELVPPIHKVTPEEKALSWRTEFGQFPPYTDAERELEKMLHGKDEEIDLALANWLVVADIPEFRDMTRESYFTQLDVMTDQVHRDMARMQASGWGGTDPDDPKTRCQRFCSAIVGLHFAYADEFREENITPKQLFALVANPNNIFLAGLMRTKRGSCASMPMIYLVIGQRLGMPVHLVTIGKHFFIRWDEPRFRMNIETTIVQKVAWTPDESVYLDTEGMTRDQLRGNQLLNFTSREVIGELFHARSAYWHTKMGKCETQSCLDLARAKFLEHFK